MALRVCREIGRQSVRRRGRWQSARGAELIEFAIVMPMFLFLLAGIFDFGMMFRTFEVVTNAAREGARVGVLPGYAAEDIEDRVDAYMAVSGLTGAYTVTVANTPVATGAGTFTARAVTVNYTYQFVVLGPIAGFFGGSFTTMPLQAVSVMRTETQAAAP
jgi:Flp pilus assembly protein TadG